MSRIHVNKFSSIRIEPQGQQLWQTVTFPLHVFAPPPLFLFSISEERRKKKTDLL